MIKSLLIANRGEIACRIIRTAREMGIRTIAVYSDADAKALHVRQADEAVHIGASPAAESYLVGAKIIAAAKETGAEAIHPGYGFLSENADFAQAVIDAGIIWVGPKPESIRAMGLKDAAKTLMQDAGVLTTPGYLGDNQDADYLASQAAEIGYPVLIKAVAGGGGKGMRKVDRAEDFADDLLSCQREAKSSFGNDIVLIEKWITSPRHIEVQVFGDSHGNVVHLFERDCSLQRRHQKVIEEAPAPGMDEATREELCAAAVRAAKAANYENAGTIEFIADASEGLRADRIWFMEMNTRLQVEHPVTEEITGIDLVEWQLRVASGEKLPKKQDELSINGHAIEARLYAEDPSTGFLPSIGELDYLMFPDNVRVDTGVAEADVISSNYDPMIAKLISTASTRGEAIDQLQAACDNVVCESVKTNAWFLSRLLNRTEFRLGIVTTGFIGDFSAELSTPCVPSPELLQAAADHFIFHDDFVSGAVGDPEFDRLRGKVGFRLNGATVKKVRLLVNKEEQEVAIDTDAFWTAGYPTFAGWSSLGQTITVHEKGAAFSVSLFREEGNQSATAADGAILSPMPGKIIAVEVSAGDTVVAGQKLVTLEAMKMEHSLTAPHDGVVEELDAVVGGQVSEGAMLVKITSDEKVDA